MKTRDFLFVVLCAESFTLIFNDFSRAYQAGYWQWISIIIFPVISLICFWFAGLFSKKHRFFLQIAKYILVGIFITLVDLKVFEFLWLILTLEITGIVFLYKGVSFIVATFIKYWGNKIWVFEKLDGQNIIKEGAIFFLATIIGLLIDVTVFFYFVRILGPQFGIPVLIWTKISVILAALTAAIWNFLGYKFLVFKK